MSDVPDVAELLRTVHAQQQSIEKLVRIIENQQATAANQAAGGNAERPRKPRPVDWFTISGHERLAAWQVLAEFVEAIVFRYNVQRSIRPCWWLHPPAVEELTALWHIRQVMYGPEATLANAMDWQNSFAQSMHRLYSMFGSCRESHTDTTNHVWMSDQTRNDFYNAIRAEVMDA